MDVQKILSLLDNERRVIAYGESTIDVLPEVSRLASFDGRQHSVVFSAMTLANADEVISEQIAYYRSIDRGFEWKVYRHDEPPGLQQRLASRGFVVGPLEAVLVLDLAERPAWVDETDTSTVLRLDDVEQLQLYREVAEAVFGKDYDFTIRELSHAIRHGDKGHRGYVAIADGRPVSCARLYTHPQSVFGGLYGGGTVTSHRGHGHYRQLVAARAKDARAAGAKYLIVDALPTSRPILERLGFVHLTDTWPCEWSP